MKPEQARFGSFWGHYVFSEGFASDRRKASRASANQNVAGLSLLYGAPIKYYPRRREMSPRARVIFLRVLLHRYTAALQAALYFPAATGNRRGDVPVARCQCTRYTRSHSSSALAHSALLLAALSASQDTAQSVAARQQQSARITVRLRTNEQSISSLG